MKSAAAVNRYRKMGAVFLCAFVLRVGLGAIFFGSVDMTNSVLQSHSLSDRVPAYLPYFPFVETLLFLVAQVHDHTGLPLTMPIKTVPAIADSLVASALVGMEMLHPDRRLSFAWLYATCPLAVILVSFHGQWDPLWLLPAIVALAVADQARRSPPFGINAFIGGSLAVAAICKPIPLALAPAALVTRDLWSSARSRASIAVTAASLVGVLGLMLLVYDHLGFEIGRVLEGVLGYGASSRTVVVFGLPRLLKPVGVSVGHLRLASIGFAGLILFRRLLVPHRQSRMATAAAVCLVLPAVGGLAPQYLLWALPFIIASNSGRLAIGYATLASLFLVAFYTMPRSSFIEGENLATFLPLRGLAWLAPPATLTQWFDGEGVLSVYRIVADLGVPLGMVLVAILLLRSSKGDNLRRQSPLTSMTPAVLLVLPVVLAVVGGALAYWAWPRDQAAERNRAQLTADSSAYLARPPGLGQADSVRYRPLETARGPILFSAPALLAAAIVIWAAVAFSRCRPGPPPWSRGRAARWVPPRPNLPGC